MLALMAASEAGPNIALLIPCLPWRFQKDFLMSSESWLRFNVRTGWWHKQSCTTPLCWSNSIWGDQKGSLEAARRLSDQYHRLWRRWCVFYSLILNNYCRGIKDTSRSCMQRPWAIKSQHVRYLLGDLTFWFPNQHSSRYCWWQAQTSTW